MTELDLGEFVCEQVNISFAAVSEHGMSNFSPSKSFCIQGKFIYNIAQALLYIYV